MDKKFMQFVCIYKLTRSRLKEKIDIRIFLSFTYSKVYLFTKLSGLSGLFAISSRLKKFRGVTFIDSTDFFAKYRKTDSLFDK